MRGGKRSPQLTVERRVRHLGQWSHLAQIGSADSELDVLSVAFSNSSLIAGTWNAPYQSTSGGATWGVLAGTGLPADTAVRAMATIGGALFVGTTGHVYMSLDNGGTWTDASSGIGSAASITSMVASGTSMLAASDSAGGFLTSYFASLT
jgi:hypothetical protein